MQEEKAFRIYVTDALRLFGHLNIRYADIFENRQGTADNMQNEDEIKERICNLLEKMETAQ